VTEPSQEFLHELLRRFHQRFDKLELQGREMRDDTASMRNQIYALQGDVHNLRGILARIEDRLDQVENRLELRDFQEVAQSSFKLDQ
jgi:hypothetical protein